MDRLLVLLPALAVLALVVVLLAVYTAKLAVGRRPLVEGIKTNEIFGEFWSGYAYWALRPLERALIAAGVSPNFVTFLSFLACAGTGLAVALGHLATGCWLYILAGALDMLDGRLARALGKQSPAGALFDSVTDRWAELAAFAGYAWYLRATPWVMAAIACTGTSMMVSYTRARCEGLGLTLRGGAMQRAERMTLVASGTLLAAAFHAGASTASWVVPAVGATLALCALLSMATALRRWRDGHRALTG